MPTPISDVRVCRSFIGGALASTVVTQEIDFDISVQQAIEVFAVYAVFGQTAVTIPTSMPDTQFAHVSLHREQDAIVAPNNIPADADELDIDSEVIAEFFNQASLMDGSTEAAAGWVPSNHAFVYPQPLLTARNLTHRTETDAAFSVASILLIHYRYVKLSAQETVLMFGRHR